jgi:hypothetical protein
MLGKRRLNTAECTESRARRPPRSVRPVARVVEFTVARSSLADGKKSAYLLLRYLATPKLPVLVETAERSCGE